MLENDEFVRSTKTTPRKAKEYNVPSQYKLADVSNITIKQRFFQNKEFCVFADEKADLSKLITELGGFIVAHPSKNTTNYIVVGPSKENSNLKYSNLFNKSSVSYYGLF